MADWLIGTWLLQLTGLELIIMQKELLKFSDFRVVSGHTSEIDGRMEAYIYTAPLQREQKPCGKKAPRSITFPENTLHKKIIWTIS